MISLTQFLASCFRISFCGLLDSLSKIFLTSSKKFLKNVFLLILSFLFFSSASFVAMEVESSLVGGKQEKGVEKFLGFKVSKSFLITALQPRTLSFERVEFLGDRVLGLTVAHFLYHKYPSAEVPELAKEGVTASLNLGWLYYTHSIHNPLTRADDLQHANSNTRLASYHSGGLSGLTEEETN